MSSESYQHRIDRVRKPRVHITYDVEVGGAMVKRELPFVVGVLGDFSGKPTEPLAPLRERNFIEISRDNFDGVLERMKPRASFSVPNKITKGGDDLGVDITFENIRSFDPDQVVQKVPALNALVETRRRLSDLLTKVDGNEPLNQMLKDIIKDSGAQQELGDALEKARAEEAERAAMKEDSNE